MLYQAGGLQWLDSRGGPLILTDRQWLANWRGHSPPPPDGSAMSDYERACAIAGYLGILPIGSGQALVLGDEPLSTAWWPSPNFGGGILVGWRWAPAGTSIVSVLEHLPADVWTKDEITLPLPTGQALLFDAAEDAMTIGASLSINLSPGAYRVDTVEYSPEPAIALLLHRLVPAAE